MRQWLAPIVAGVLCLAAAPAVAEEDVGYSLKSEWDEGLLRILDRHGRPAPDGPVQQRFAGERYPEYRLDLEVADFRLAGQLKRARNPEGVRLWVQSVDEYELANRIELEKRASAGNGYVGFRYDQFQTREWNTRSFRLDFGLTDIPVDGAFGALRFYPRWRKDDSDIELQVGYSNDAFGTARLRVLSLDPFTNASGGLARARGVEKVDRQLGPGLLLVGEVATVRWNGLRGELYGGVGPRFSTRFVAENGAQFVREESSRMLGGMVEMQTFDLLTVGTAATLFDTDHERRGVESDAPALSVEEKTRELEVYGIARPIPALELEGLVRHTARPERRSGTDAEFDRRNDREWWMSLRSEWWFHRVAAAELALIRLTREGSGPGLEQVRGTNHRLTTRMTLRLADSVRTTFGVGWDLDQLGGTVYDGGGLMMTGRF